MNADINKCAEVDYISDRAFKLHSLFKSLMSRISLLSIGAGSSSRDLCPVWKVPLQYRQGLEVRFREHRQVTLFPLLLLSAEYRRSCLILFLCQNIQEVLKVLLRLVAFRVNACVIKRISLSGTRKNPAHCSNALGPSFGTFLSSALDENAPFSSR